MGKPREKKIGRCLLTGEVGPFAKSHIIPDAFMRRASDAPLKEWDGTGRPKRSFTGWYDTGILGHTGEAIIAKYDDAAAKCFIDHGYTYRSRRDPLNLGVLTDKLIPRQIYEIANVNAKTMHLFALSLLWRAAVSTLPACSLITVRPKRLEEIRARLLAGDPGPPDEFPAYFSVFCGAEELPKMAPFQMGQPTFACRFFLDGVVCYVSPRKHARGLAAFESFFVGRCSDVVNLVCVPSDTSQHARRVKEQVVELFDQHGDIFRGGSRVGNFSSNS
ncbi:hypothetical protein ABGN05_19995 [Aquibium sp. LZ166]|uniref:Uncharacterized protein n=1 Tax=Aquibium pacificus TaxID=3153579 RepID=A0ABV3SMK5_9HYPH